MATATRQQQPPQSAGRPPKSAGSLSRSSERLIDVDDVPGETGGLVNPSLSPGDGPAKVASFTTAVRPVSHATLDVVSSVSPLGSSPEELASPLGSDHAAPSPSAARMDSDGCETEVLENSSPSLPRTADTDLGPNPLNTILSNQELLTFATQIISPGQVFQCTIIRDKRGIDRSLYPTYYLHLQGEKSACCLNNTITFFLTCLLCTFPSGCSHG